MGANYCAVSAKLKAMHSLYLTSNDYKALLAKKTVPEICSYLKNETGYSQVLESVDDKSIHRLDLERYLASELKKEYVRMYEFVGQKERKLLYLWFMRSEIEFLKQVIQRIFNNEDDSIAILTEYLSDFFKAHTKIDIESIGKVTTFEDLIKACENTVYHNVLLRSSKVDVDAFEITMRLDSYYYRCLWKAKDTYMPKSERPVFEDFVGRDIDALNVLWIYRSRKYFSVDREMVYTYLIPIRYKLKREQITSMVEADTDEAFFNAVRETPYAMLFDRLDDGFFVEERYTKMIYSITKSIYKNHPNSINAVFAYFKLKEVEISNLRTIIEGARYSFNADAIAEHICI